MVKGLANKLGLNNIYIYIIVAFLAVIFISTGSASALTSQSATGFQFSFNSSLSITLSSSDLVIPHLTPGNYASSNTISVDVSTNNSHGYTLTAKVGDKSIQKFANNNLVNAESPEATFASLLTSDKLAISNFGNGKWGYTTDNAVSAASTYSGLLYNADTVINATRTSNGLAVESYPGTNTTYFTIGARAGLTQASGEYSNTINFRGVANVDTYPVIDTMEYMQDFKGLTSSERETVLASMNEGKTYQLKDNRDDKVYNIAKLKDGKVWLLDNLALDPATLKSGVTLSSANTNMASGATFTLPASASTGFTSYTTAMINTDYKNTDVNLAVGQSGADKVGVYYNYCAATAGTYCYPSDQTGTSDAYYDICPAGWRMPTGGASGEYQALRDQYDSHEGYVLALRVSLDGIYSGSESSSRNSYGTLWSSTYYIAADMYTLYANERYIDAQFGNTRHRSYGMPVRCVAEAETYPVIGDMEYMQDLSSLSSVNKDKILASMNSGQSYQLKDNRDDKVYNVAKLKDGKVWLLDNLALDPATLKSGVTLNSSNTNIASGASFTLPASSSSDFASFTAAMINTAYKNTDVNLAMGQTGTGKIGVYYNYCAASAGTYCFPEGQTGTSNATHDICPAGWRMPTGGASGEYQILRNQYSSEGDYVLALKTTLSGYYSANSAGNQDNSGSFWSSTYFSAKNMYRLTVYIGSNSNPQHNDWRNIGFAVRCITK